MAISDRIGDLAQAYMTNAERAAKNGVQSLTDGPIARASSQLPAAATLGAVAPAAAVGLDSLSAVPTQTPPAQLPQQSLSSLSPSAPSDPVSVVTPPQQGDLASLAPTTAGLPAQQAPAADPQPSLDAAFRPTAIGTGAGNIAARVGPSGVPEFTNQPADLASAAGRGAAPIAAQLPTSLSQIAPTGGQVPDPTASLEGLGSAANLGDGIGTFSQGQAGDSALAMSRFQRASDLRQDYKDQDRLDRALAAKTRANNTTIVRDSSRPITKADVYRDKQDQQAAEGRLANIANAQGAIAGRQQSRGNEQTLQRNARIEDVLATGQAAGATPEQQAAAQRVLDPTGKNAFARQQAQAQLTNTQLEGQLKQQDLTQKAQAQQQATQDRIKGQEGQVATFDQALGSIDSLLGKQVDPKNPTGKRLDEDPGLAKSLGRFDALTPTLPGGDAADFQARLDTLKAQTFLPQIAALRGTGALSDAEGKKLSDSVGALSTKMSEGAFRKSLGEVRSTLQTAKDRSGKIAGPTAGQAAAVSAQPAAAPTTIPTITSKAQADALPAGSIFIGPDGKQYRK